VFSSSGILWDGLPQSQSRQVVFRQIRDAITSPERRYYFWLQEQGFWSARQRWYVDRARTINEWMDCCAQDALHCSQLVSVALSRMTLVMRATGMAWKIP